METKEVTGTLQQWKNGALDTDYTGVTVTLSDANGDNSVTIPTAFGEGGAYSIKVLNDGNEYKLTISKEGYTDLVIPIASDVSELNETKLLYERFSVLGSDQNHVLSNVNDPNPTIGNNGGLLRVISNDTYSDVEASLWLKKNNCPLDKSPDGTQGILIKFDDDKYMVARIQKEQDADYFKIQWMGSINWLGDGFADTSTVLGEGFWADIVKPIDDTQQQAFENSDGDGLKLTVKRMGNVLVTYVNGNEAGPQVQLPDEYVSKTVQVGFFDWGSAENAVWKFAIQ